MWSACGAINLYSPHSQKPSKECEPYAYHENKPIAPCGAIANSMFNGEPVSCCAHQTHSSFHLYLICLFTSLADTLELFYNDPNGTKIQIPMTATGIAWWTDKHVKFRNPTDNANLTAVFQGIIKEEQKRKSVNARQPYVS